MKLKLMVASIGIGALLLTGCGGGGDDAPTVIEEAQDKLVGTWLDGISPTGCDDYSHGVSSVSSKVVLIIDDSDFVIETKDYNNSSCEESGLTMHELETYEYNIVGTAKSTENHDAFKIDLIKTKYTLKKGTTDDPESFNTGAGTEIKTMFLFDSDHLVFSKKGVTRTDRTNEFNLSQFWTKQP
jgi:hypothetical protein